MRWRNGCGCSLRDGGSRNRGGNTREEREGQSTESESLNNPDYRHAQRCRVKGQKVTQSRPPARAIARRGHALLLAVLLVLHIAGGRTGAGGHTPLVSSHPPARPVLTPLSLLPIYAHHPLGPGARPVLPSVAG